MRNPPTSAVEIAGLSYSYPDGTNALCEVDLSIARGEHVAILGPNGAGKSTLMLHLNGLLDAKEGDVRIHGEPLTKGTLKRVRREVGLVFQDPDDQLFMPTVAKDVAFGPANYGLRGEELAAVVQDALAAVDMSQHSERPPHLLSGGQRHRVALATVLAMKPTILVLDEPAANLDPRARREFAELVMGLDLTIVMVTHDIPYASQICDRGIILDAGRVVADGDLCELLLDDDLLMRHRLELPFGFTPPGRV